MATAAVLQPLDANIPFDRPVAVSASRHVPRPAKAPGRTPVSSNKSHWRRRGPLDDQKRRKETARKAVNEASEMKELVMEKVRILKRGENFNPNSSPKFVQFSSDDRRRVKESSVAVDERLSVCRKKGGGVEVDLVAGDKRFNVSKKKGAVFDGFAGDGFTALAPLPCDLPMPKMNWRRKEEKVKIDDVDVSVASSRISRLNLL